MELTHIKNNTTFYFPLLGLLLVSSLSFSQSYSDEEDTRTALNTPPQNVNKDLLIDTTPNPRLKTLEGNSVFVKQIGEYNQVKVVAQTNSSEINLLQKGDNNAVNLDYNLNAVITDVVQDGDYNTVKDYVYGKNKDVSLELQQEGNDLYFERFGSNGISKSLKFKQTEASPAIIVRSFK